MAASLGLAVVLVVAACRPATEVPSPGTTTQAIARCVVLNGETVTDLTWSPDGRYLVVLSQDAQLVPGREDHLRVADPATLKLTEIAHTQLLGSGPAMRSDGRVEWYEITPGSPTDTVLSSDGSGPPRREFATSDLVFIAATADGIVYGTVQRSTLRLRVRDDLGTEHDFALIPDAASIRADAAGTTIAVLRNLQSTATFSLVTASGERMIAEVPKFPLLYGLTPRGDAILYATLDDQLLFTGLYTVPLDGGLRHEVRLPEGISSVGPLHISPAGQIAFAGWQDATDSRFCIRDASAFGL